MTFPAHLHADLVVIGGGATGAGVARDGAMRGFETILLERADIAQGTSARYHGLLHSGGRYVISDSESASQCADENAILKRINADAIEDVGGLFVLLPGDDEDFANRFLPAALTNGVKAEEISVSEALREEPRLNPHIKRAFRVNDGALDGWRLVWGALESAREYGAKILPYHNVTAITVEKGEVRSLTARNEKTGEELHIEASFVINAAGPWAGRVATLAGASGVEVVPGRGIMMGMNQRLVHHVVNRLAFPGDGDILVPAHPISIIGTTDQAASKPDFLRVLPQEVQLMLDRGEEILPGLRQARPLHVWAGARPLLRDTRVAKDDTRHMSRGMAIIDHLERDGIRGFATIAGGKFSTYRLMAQNVVNVMCNQLGVSRPCRTAEEPVPSASTRRFTRLSDRLAQREEDRHDEPIICECELVNRQMILDALKANPAMNGDDLRRQLRIGMGPCQGTFCAPRLAGILAEFHASRPAAAFNTAADTTDAAGDTPPTAHNTAAAPDITAATAPTPSDLASTALRLFHSNRAQGYTPLLYGGLLEEIALNSWVNSTLGADLLPAPGPAARLATGDLALNHGIERDPIKTSSTCINASTEEAAPNGDTPQEGGENPCA